MNNREDFEKYLIDAELQDTRGEILWQTWQEATARAQKIIDELKEELEEKERFVKTTRNDCIYYLKKIERLEALTPDVPCPVCGGKVIIDRDYSCTFCDFVTGKVPLTKAQEYRIRELERQIKSLQDSVKKLNDILGGVV